MSLCQMAGRWRTKGLAHISVFYCLRDGDFTKCKLLPFSGMQTSRQHSKVNCGNFIPQMHKGLSDPDHVGINWHIFRQTFQSLSSGTWLSSIEFPWFILSNHKDVRGTATNVGRNTKFILSDWKDSNSKIHREILNWYFKMRFFAHNLNKVNSIKFCFSQQVGNSGHLLILPILVLNCSFKAMLSIFFFF